MRIALALFLTLLLAASAGAQVCNLKIVTDASPDYADMDSLLGSITSQWPTPEEKCRAVFYWHHINRRQMAPMWLHGMELADPIRQWNDYGFTMCSTVCGINCSVFSAMGLPVRHWEIQAHTVPEVFYDGRWHMYDSSMSALYTLCDGKTLAGVEDIGKTQGCEASGGKAEFAHIAKYHCLMSTGPNGLLTGADCERYLKQEGICFNPNKIHNQDDLWWDRGHRFVLNLNADETYTRYYHKLGDDVAFFTPNQNPAPKRKGTDPDNPKYKIRGNGVRTWAPVLPAGGFRPTVAGKPAEMVFKVEGANVITSMNIKADVTRKSPADSVRILIAPAAATKDDRWVEVWKCDALGEQTANIDLVDKVSGEYEILVKVELAGAALLRHIEFKSTTQVNAKALPRLDLGRNVVYVGAGEQTESVVLWPELQAGRYKPYAVEEQNIVGEAEHPQVAACIHPAKANEDGWVTFRLDAPRDISKVTYGGRVWNHAPNSKVEFLHSFDGGKTWAKSWSYADVKTPADDSGQRPYDVIHFETVGAVPAGTKSVLFRYLMSSTETTPKGCGLMTARMEADYAVENPGFRPMDVTFTWKERQEDYTLVERSHTQRVERVPFTYVINTAGADHPQMESMRVSRKGAQDTKYGYSDGKDVGGKKFVSFKAIYGKNFALDKKYELSKPSSTAYKAGDTADTHKLTDGIAWSAYGGGMAYSYGCYWDKPKDVTITVDLEKTEKVGAFRTHVHGYKWFDAMQGEMPEKIEVSTSVDGKDYASRGFFNLNLRWKDLPADFMWPDSERFEGHMFDLVLPAQVDARYVRFTINSPRSTAISEVQALDFIRYEPFDLRVALPKDAPAVN